MVRTTQREPSKAMITISATRNSFSSVEDNDVLVVASGFLAAHFETDRIPITGMLKISLIIM
jgi:hypothetical protein